MKTKQTSCNELSTKDWGPLISAYGFSFNVITGHHSSKTGGTWIEQVVSLFPVAVVYWINSKWCFWVPVWFLICNRRSVTKPVNIPTKWQSFQWTGIWTATEMSAHVSVTMVKALIDDMCCREWRHHNCSVISCLVSDDHSRVKLENSENDYINASLVDVEEAQRAYILSQVCRL